MRLILRVIAGLVVLVWTSGSWLTGVARAQPPVLPTLAPGLSTQVRDAGGRVLATATFRDAPGQVLINLVLPDPSALFGTRGMQIHETGRCDPPDFSSAGGIVNPFNKQHGFLNPDGPMAGDIPNLVISPDGLSTYNTAASLVSLAPGAASLVRPSGSSLIIYARSDDQLSQPEGNPGARLGCGVIVAAGPGATAGGSASGAGTLDGIAALPIGLLGALVFVAGVVLRRRRSA